MNHFKRELHELIGEPKLSLLLARDKKVLEDTFSSGLCGWQIIEGEWHKMTIDSNVDISTGLDGTAKAVDTLGSYSGGIVEKDVYLDNYGEITFEHYIQNNENIDGQGIRVNNYLRFYVDNILKLEIKGPSPWYRSQPIGLPPGRHRLKFQYDLNGGKPHNKKAVVDTVTIYEAKTMRCLIKSYFPPKPVQGLAQNKILRGFSIFQEMTQSDTQIEFEAAFDGLHFHEFMKNRKQVFYFLDEFGVCYRGVFNDAIEPKSIALNKLYFVSVTFTSGSEVGVGFC